MFATKYLPDSFRRGVRRLETRLRAVSGEFYCPVCESRVETFNALPDFFLSNASKHGFPYPAEDAETCNYKQYACPFCEASDRERLYALFLREYLRGRADERISIIDFAPAPSLSAFLQKLIKPNDRISYRTADFFAAGVDDRVDIEHMDIYEDQQFDFFICSHVLEHVTDDRQALGELYRVLKKNGKGILMVPIILSVDEIDEDPAIVDEGERWKRFGQFDHVRLYSKKGFLERARNAGFAVRELAADYFGANTFERNGITPQSVLYVVEK